MQGLIDWRAMRSLALVATVATVALAGCLDPNDKFMPATESESAPPPSGSTGEPPPTDGEPDETTAPPPTTTTEMSTPDTGDGPICGNGVVEAGEGCDDGDASDTNDCTNVCQVASCGDGIVWAGHEPCDDGDDDDGDECVGGCKVASCGDGFLHVGKEECDDGNDVDTDECTVLCKDPTCGDGILKGDEECDDGNAEPWDGCEVDCVFSEFWMFVTSTKFNGDMESLQGADMQCVAAAMEAQLPGPPKYKAWLSDNMTAAASRIEHGLGRYRRTDDVIIADSWDELTSGQLQVAINRTEFEGDPPPASKMLCDGSSSLVFTNTSVNGGQYKPQFDCNKWSTWMGPAAFGDPNASDDSWTQACEWMGMDACSTMAPIYCIQEPM